MGEAELSKRAQGKAKEREVLKEGASLEVTAVEMPG